MNKEMSKNMIGETSNNELLESSLTVTNVRLAHKDLDLARRALWRVDCHHGRVVKVSLLQNMECPDESSGDVDAKGSIMIPSLCHSHIHLDKCFILDRCGIVSGQFNEAMEVTGKAKASFPLDSEDLYARGARLILESVEYGVTSMRAHVEVDTIVRFTCLDVAQTLKNEYKKICDIQIVVFAQEPLFGGPEDTTPGPNFPLLQQAIQRDGITVIGSAPYVEPTPAQAKLNVALIMETACKENKHVDFHLDYNLDGNTEPLIYEVISQARKNITYWNGSRRPQPRITIGHATRLQLFTPAQWRDLAEAIKDLPITFIGLPQSDIYMQGRGDYNKPLGAPRSTLRVPYILNNYGIAIAMGVNNVQNAFTPQGSLDPLSLCTFGVALFQSATASDTQILLQSVTLTSKLAIGQYEAHKDLFPSHGDPADFVILHGNESVQSAVLQPSHNRTTIRSGVVVARRRIHSWFLATDRTGEAAQS